MRAAPGSRFAALTALVDGAGIETCARTHAPTLASVPGARWQRAMARSAPGTRTNVAPGGALPPPVTLARHAASLCDAPADSYSRVCLATVLEFDSVDAEPPQAARSPAASMSITNSAAAGPW